MLTCLFWKQWSSLLSKMEKIKKIMYYEMIKIITTLLRSNCCEINRHQTDTKSKALQNNFPDCRYQLVAEASPLARSVSGYFVSLLTHLVNLMVLNLFSGFFRGGGLVFIQWWWCDLWLLRWGKIDWWFVWFWIVVNSLF